MTVTRTFDILERYKEKFIKDDALAVKRNGIWEKFTTAQYIDEVNSFSCGLLAFGFKKGDKIATVSNNRPEWNFVDMGMSQIGVVHVPIYPTISNEDYLHILKHSESRIMLVSDADFYNKVKPLVDATPNIEGLYTFDQVEGIPNWSEISKLGKEKMAVLLPELTKRKAEIEPNDLMTIIYTSGTTGVPKGVMLSHYNVICNMIECLPILPIGHKERALSFLPLCHVLERMVNYIYQHEGVSIYYAESLQTVGENCREINPHCIVAVPRIIEKVYDRIISKGKDLHGIKRRLFFWAVELGLRYKESGNSAWYNIQRSIANKLIYVKWREALGGNLKLIVSGGAALQQRLARVFWAAGIPIQEGYGLTETSPVISVNYNYIPKMKFGSVGPVLNNVQVKIAEDGEILFKGPNLMLGYYKAPEKTKEVIDDEGWFHTGDIGELDSENFLKITDRKKEIFKLSTGKYVAPQPIENQLKESYFIEQAMVIGDGKNLTGALISPNFEFLHDWCSRYKIHYRDNVELIENPQVVARYQREIDKVNERLGQIEKIKKFQLVCEQWSTETGELSPTLKLRRKFVMDKYKHRILQVYPENVEV